LRKPKLKLVQPGQSHESLLDSARNTIAKGLATLDRCVDRVSAMLEDDELYDDKAASHLAWLLKNQSQIVGELRKLEAHDKRSVATMKPDEKDRLVWAYVEDLPVERRHQLRSRLDDLDEKERLLS
jgi:hypothetical protein